MRPHYAEGIHLGQITQQGLSKAGTGTPQFFLRFKVLGELNGDNYDTHKQQYERTIFMALTPKTVEFVQGALETLGYEHNTFGPLDPANAQHQSFVGQQQDFYCQHERSFKDPNDWVEKWSLSRKMETKALSVEALSSKEVRQLDSLFGAALKGKKQAEPVRPSRVDNIHDVGITDDDIPF
jgi:hypothetical protein